MEVNVWLFVYCLTNSFRFIITFSQVIFKCNDINTKVMLFVQYIYYISQSGRTPLHEASEYANEEVVDALIKAGANVNMVSYFLHYNLIYIYIYIYIHMHNNNDSIVLKGTCFCYLSWQGFVKLSLKYYHVL